MEQARWSVRYYFWYPPGKEENYKNHVRLAENRWRTEMGSPRRQVPRFFVFMFCWPCISIHPCNENQLDALFIVSLFRHPTSTCFGHICSPPSGGILYIHNKWYVLRFLVDCLLASREICPKYVEVNLWNKLRINSASSWFSLHGSAQMSLRHKPAQPGLQRHPSRVSEIAWQQCL